LDGGVIDPFDGRAIGPRLNIGILGRLSGPDDIEDRPGPEQRRSEEKRTDSNDEQRGTHAHKNLRSNKEAPHLPFTFPVTGQVNIQGVSLI